MEKSTERVEAESSEEQVSESDIEALHNAINQQDLAAMESCLVRCPGSLTAMGTNFETAIYKVIRTGNQDALNILMRHGLDLNTKSAAGGDTALNKAIQCDSISMVRSLIDHGASMYVKNHINQNAMNAACMGDNIQMIDELLSRGMDINEKEESGIGYFAYAARVSNIETITHLLKKGIEQWQLDAALKEMELNGMLVFRGEFEDINALIKEYQAVHHERQTLEDTVLEGSDSMSDSHEPAGLGKSQPSKKAIRI